MFKKLFASIAASTAAVACALAVLGAGAGTAMAPEAGRLNSNSPLAASGYATYGFYLSNYWQSGYPYLQYAGYPCSRTAQPGGATLRGYIVTSGNLSRCTEF